MPMGKTIYVWRVKKNPKDWIGLLFGIFWAWFYFGVPKEIPADKAVYFRFMQGARQETHFVLLLVDL